MLICVFIFPPAQQVEEWGQELIEIEDQAKQIAQLLLFVIDNSTRSMASLVEAAYFAGKVRFEIKELQLFLIFLIFKIVYDEICLINQCAELYFVLNICSCISHN